MSDGRLNIAAALSSDGARDIPVVLPYTGIYIRDHWEQLTRCPWWYQASPDLTHQLAWHREVISAIGQDWFDLPSFYPLTTRQNTAIEVNRDRVTWIDVQSGARRVLQRPRQAGWSPHGEVESIHPDRTIDTPGEIDGAIPLPNPAPAPDDGRHDLARTLLSEFGAGLYPMGYVAAPLWQTYHVWGFEDMMTMIATRPDLVRRACERLLANGIAGAREAATRGAAGIWIEDCMTDMVSPEAFRTLNVAYVRPLVEEIRSLGMSSIYYFCGNPTGKWDLLLSAGADALSLEESKKGFTIDIADVVNRVGGRCAVLGNLDAIAVLQDGDEESLRAEVARQIAAGRRNGSRFVMSLGSPVTPGTSASRVRLYCDLAHVLGKG